MEQTCTEGVAIHGGPEPCGSACKGRAEALDRVDAGCAIELRNQESGVLEVERPRRPRQKSGKSDQLDAIAAAREALAADKLAMPRLRGAREVLRILLTTREGALKARSQALSQLHALVVGAPEMLRCRLRRLGTAALVTRCSQLRQHQPQQCIELHVTIQALRSVARRAEALSTEAAGCEKELVRLVGLLAPVLVTKLASVRSARLRSSAPGHTMAVYVLRLPSRPLLVWRRSRLLLDRSSAADLIEAVIASSIEALHTTVIRRMNFHPQSKAYWLRRRGEGKE